MVHSYTNPMWGIKNSGTNRLWPLFLNKTCQSYTVPFPKDKLHLCTEGEWGTSTNFKLQLLRSFKNTTGTSLVAQWLRIRLPMQRTQVRALIREDPTCHRATKPMSHSYWACALEPTSHNYWAHVPQLLKLTRLEPVLCNKRSHRNEKPVHCNEE